MSRQTITRRVTRVTGPAVQMDSENANARPSRIISRVKPPSTSAIPAPTATLQSKAFGATSALITAPIRRTTRSAIAPEVKPLKDVKEEIASNDDDAMAVDDHPPVPAPSRRVSTRRSGANTQQVITQEVQRVQTARLDLVTSRPKGRNEVHDNRVSKKRRTSSDAPETDIDEQAQHEAEVAAVLDADVAPEADPDGDEWGDLDADDPVMVSEYVVEIFKYMKQTELITLPNPEYMASQKELAWSMRGILLDWLVQVHARFRLLPETLFLCVNIIDRFLSARVVSLAKLQLVGIACLFVASKVEEIVAQSVSHFLHCADSSYTESEILLARYPNPMHFLRRISKADDYDVKSRTMGKHSPEVGTLEWWLLATPPSLVAAAVTWLGRLILGTDKWVRQSSIIPTANLMLNYIPKPVRHESFYKKYAGKRFMKVSILVREWALERWEEGEQVSLLAELPAIRAKNRERLAAAGLDGDEDVKDENS
ncbi:cyclin-like protein [Suillus lakei]|nr:cyclin-like protein [Suillus lakei]